MVYGVPYSFVPGTKAKADEVNANFNDIIQKLQDTNEVIDDNYNLLNSEISSINETLAQKANSTDIDGAWKTKSLVLADNVNISEGGGTKTYSLSSYLPADGNIYEVLFSYTADMGTATNVFCVVGATTSNAALATLARMQNTRASGNTVILIVGTNRSVSLVSTSAQKGTLTNYFMAKAYRKVR